MSKKVGTNLAESYTNFLRKSSKRPCPIPGCNEEILGLDNNIRNHLQTRHASLLASSDLIAVIQDIKKGVDPTRSASAEPHAYTRDQPTFSRDPGGGQTVPPRTTHDESSVVSPHKRRKSPDSSARPNRPRSASPPRRSRARPPGNTEDSDFHRRSPQQGKLWNPDDAHASSSPRTRTTTKPTKNPTQHRPRPDSTEQDNDVIELLKQPETRPISQEQLVAEVKGIYAGLVMVESKCIEVDNAQSSQNDHKLNNEQWQALIALHRTLLHEHHDFFLASQHPSASSALRRLASKYAMPARMWRHGIHSFLELLRHRLPDSLEHMLAFIYLAYSMMALLYETVPAFEDTWIECLGDLGRYRMAIEDDDIRDRDVWTSVSRLWYSKASDKSPTTGRLYHHLAILARPNALQQLYYYAKSLCVLTPFGSARESILTLFDPLLSPTHSQASRLIPIDVSFVRSHGILFSSRLLDKYHSSVDEFFGMLDNHIGRTTHRWMESGYYIAIANCCCLLSYGKAENVIMQEIKGNNLEGKTDQTTEPRAVETKPNEDFGRAQYLAKGTYVIVFSRSGDPNILPFVHVVLVFMFHLSRFPNAMRHTEKWFPWTQISDLLNDLLKSYHSYSRLHDIQFPREGKDVSPRPLPEDFAMRGLLWVTDYYPEDWYSNEKIDDDEKYLEAASMTDERKERILWVGCRIAKTGKWLTYDETTHLFGVNPEYQEQEVDAIAKDAGSMEISEDFTLTPTFASATTASRTASWSSDKDYDEVMDVDDTLTNKPIVHL
ncbi:hypothetical protein F5Y15DRAFT_164368 [Xylariaceae sp. FL0016]|nr:hypothetical protein F5Y15DRAFT_164368 [Xylariaceae sp. FL0016]